MDARSPPTPGLSLCHERKPAVRAKALLDSAGQVEALQSAKKACVLSHLQSTPGPSKELLLCSPGSASFQESTYFLDDSGYDNLVASSSASKYDDYSISLYASRCFDDSEPDEFLLELSDSEEGNSFDYTEEEIQEILADDCEESEQNLTRKSTQSQNVKEESEKNESSSTGASALSKDAEEESEMAEKPHKRLSRDCPSVSSEELLNEITDLAENTLESAQMIRMLLCVSPTDAYYVDQPLEDSLEEAEREASEAITKDGLEYDKPAGRSGWPGSPTPSSGAREQELPKAAKSRFSRKLDSPEDDEGESTEAEEPSNSIKLRGTAVGQMGQEETTSGKKSGKVPLCHSRKKDWNNRRAFRKRSLSKRNIYIHRGHVCTKKTVAPKAEITQGPARNIPKAYTVGEHELGQTPLFPEQS